MQRPFLSCGRCFMHLMKIFPWKIKQELLSENPSPPCAAQSLPVRRAILPLLTQQLGGVGKRGFRDLACQHAGNLRHA